MGGDPGGSPRTARAAVPVAVLVVAAIATAPLRVGLWLTPPAPALELVVVCTCFTLLAVIATGAGIYLRRLDQERERSIAAARRAQRVQLARDLHDWLAHEMTGIVLAAQAGQLTATDPKEAARMFNEIETAGTRGLDAMDRALSLLRDAVDDPDGAAERPLTHADVAEVVHRFDAGIPARVDLDSPRTSTSSVPRWWPLCTGRWSSRSPTCDGTRRPRHWCG